MLTIPYPDISPAMITTINDAFWEMIWRFGLNFAVCLIVARTLYYPKTRNTNYLFTYIIISIVVFWLSYVLEGAKLQIGFALGLFAIFGIIRYRTQSIPIKAMTYLFSIIGLSVINALKSSELSLFELLFADLSIVGVIAALEYLFFRSDKLAKKKVTYKGIELTHPKHYNELMEDLRIRTGLPIKQIKIGDIDFLKDTAQLTIYYDKTAQLPNK